MRHVLNAILFILLVPLVTFSQSKGKNWLTHKFKTADTIFLISHKLIAGSTDIVVDNKGDKVFLPKLIVNGRLNRAILKEEIIIGDKTIDSLLKILIRPNKNSISEQGGCFVPRQSIILIKDHKTSYIDICFHCDSYGTSKDLKDIPPFDIRRWAELKHFFRKHGLNYGFDNPLE